MRTDLGPLFVRQAPRIDKEKLYVRINAKDKPDSISWYDYVHIRTGRREVTCELRGDNISEIREKRMSQIYINEHLRGKLGVKIGGLPTFHIEKATRWLMPYYFVRYHPDDIVKVSTWLAVIAVGLGFLSILIAIFS